MATPGKVTDVDRCHFDYAQTLQRISDALTEDETRVLKLYCRHVIPKGIAASFTRALDIFETLQELDKIDQYNLEFLEEILERMGRPDLARDVLRPFQLSDREIPENPELQPGTSTDGASTDGATSNARLIVNGPRSMTRETENHYRYNLRSLCGTRRSQVKFKGYKKGMSILMHYTIPRESTAVLRLMADQSDPRLVFMGVKSLQIDAEAPIEVTQGALFNDIKGLSGQHTVDDIEVGCIPRTKQQRAPKNWTRLSALNLFSHTLPLHLQVAEGLEYISENKLKEALKTNTALEKDFQQAREEGKTYGRKGSEPRNFKYPRGVVVSSDNEIFVADTNNRRVQVLNTEGVYLRHFPTVVPGIMNELIMPSDVAMDGNGTLLVVGADKSPEHVVQYSTDGTPMALFDLQKSKSYRRRIAVDMRNDHILVTDAERGEVQVFRPDGSLVRSFGHPGGEMRGPRYITVDGEGNILVSDWATHSVYIYDESGKFLLKFGGEGSGEGQLWDPRGICTDSSGHIIVADSGNKRIQIFTRHGEYVRTIKTRSRSMGGVAVGPEGQLVLTNVYNHSVTVFPNYP